VYQEQSQKWLEHRNEKTDIYKEPTVWSAGASDIWSSMFHRMLTMRNLTSGDMKISRSSRKTGKLQSQKIRKISSIS
jgi:topB: DNA topoisomerase III